VRRIDSGAESWTEVAFGAGYADQAHFIREFRSLAGVTPTAFVRERRGVGIVQYPGEAES
jgi:AraC-like DNA-binding protein